MTADLSIKSSSPRTSNQSLGRPTKSEDYKSDFVTADLSIRKTGATKPQSSDKKAAASDVSKPVKEAPRSRGSVDPTTSGADRSKADSGSIKTSGRTSAASPDGQDSASERDHSLSSGKKRRKKRRGSAQPPPGSKAEDSGPASPGSQHSMDPTASGADRSKLQGSHTRTTDGHAHKQRSTNERDRSPDGSKKRRRKRRPSAQPPGSQADDAAASSLKPQPSLDPTDSDEHTTPTSPDGSKKRRRKRPATAQPQASQSGGSGLASPETDRSMNSVQLDPGETKPRSAFPKIDGQPSPPISLDRHGSGKEQDSSQGKKKRRKRRVHRHAGSSDNQRSTDALQADTGAANLDSGLTSIDGRLSPRASFDDRQGSSRDNMSRSSSGTKRRRRRRASAQPSESRADDSNRTSSRSAYHRTQRSTDSGKTDSDGVKLGLSATHFDGHASSSTSRHSATKEQKSSAEVGKRRRSKRRVPGQGAESRQGKRRHRLQKESSIHGSANKSGSQAAEPDMDSASDRSAESGQETGKTLIGGTDKSTVLRGKYSELYANRPLPPLPTEQQGTV